MSNHRNPRLNVQNKPALDNFNPGDALERLHTEIEAFAHAAGKAVTCLPPRCLQASAQICVVALLLASRCALIGLHL